MNLIEKYEPKGFDDLIFGNTKTQARLSQYAHGTRTKSLILHGPFGTGKSTAARVIAAERSVYRATDTVLFYDGCDFDSGDLKALKIEFLVKLDDMFEGVDPHPVAVIDEVDQVKRKDQEKLRSLIDKVKGGATLIMTTNHLHRVDHALVHRCDVVELPSIEPETYLDFARSIADAEGLAVTDERLLAILEKSDGSTREVIASLEDLALGLKEAA